MTTADTIGITVKRIEAVNVLKFDHFELDDINKLTLISGACNQGKTTVLRLLSLCVGGAQGAQKILHDGAEKGHVGLFLDDGYRLRRTFTEKGEYFDVLDEQGHKVPSPQTWLNERLGEYRDFNPLAWLLMPPKDQVRLLLQAIDVRLTTAEFLAATGLAAPFEVDFNAHGLLVLDDLRAHFANERKAQNKAADQKKKAAAEALASLPFAIPVIAEKRRASAEKALADARAAAQSLQARALAATQHEMAVRQLADAIQRSDTEFDDLNVEINRLRAEIAKNEEKQRQIRTRQQNMRVQLEGLATSAPPTAEDTDAARAALRVAEAEIAAIAADEKIIARFEAVGVLDQEAADAAAEASITDATIQIIDSDLRASLMAKAALPIENLTIVDGRILVGGHELQFLGEAKRIRLAVAIARALRPALRVIVLDGTEAIDVPTFELFLQEIHGDGFTYLATEVRRGGCSKHQPQVDSNCAPCGGAMEIIEFGESDAGVFRLHVDELAQLEGVA